VLPIVSRMLSYRAMQCSRLPLTLTLSPLRGERGRDFIKPG